MIKRGSLERGLFGYQKKKRKKGVIFKRSDILSKKGAMVKKRDAGRKGWDSSFIWRESRSQKGRWGTISLGT